MHLKLTVRVLASGPELIVPTLTRDQELTGALAQAPKLSPRSTN